MACECFKKAKCNLNENFRNAVKDNCVEVLESDFKNYSFIFTPGDWPPVHLPYIFHYRKAKKNGEPEARVTKVEHAVIMTYCPFCGTKFEGKSGEGK